jgi:hypothetical protein
MVGTTMPNHICLRRSVARLFMLAATTGATIGAIGCSPEKDGRARC